MSAKPAGLTQAYAGHVHTFMPANSQPPPRYAALFRNGRNQAVRIPKEFEMEGDRVRISKDGARLRMSFLGS